MSDRTPLHARSEAEAVAFALPRDRLPWTIRASNQFGRILIGSSTHVRVSGLEHIPKHGALILASNHNSNADPPLIANWLTSTLGRPVHWMAKAEAMAWPIAGPFIRMNGAFGIRRGAPDTEAFRLAKSVLDDGRVLGTFPEGTRSPTGALQAGKDGVTLLALRTGAPILPIGVIDTDLFWPRGRKLWRLGGAIGMQVGEPFTLERRMGPDGRKESLEDVTTRLMLHIAALLPPRQQGVYGPLLDAAGGTSSGAPDEAPGATPDDASGGMPNEAPGGTSLGPAAPAGF
jgi:1-acyl-sn-glycerol-3-phosphate acyltransferase